MRRPARLTLGALPFELYPDGRVLVTLPATALYPSLRSFLTASLRAAK